ncbi:hypothetical protein EDD37DRAFT_493131 [Exophiala viscosa]|uniref:uncharacterized protein n=1 Tax=Exophiala viscosa TaxID=2486360 RepID=UPI00219888F5|nr:hypothetical protein EDD37DRAFT_493131 [Exophiala viscosa]
MVIREFLVLTVFTTEPSALSQCLKGSCSFSICIILRDNAPILNQEEVGLSDALSTIEPSSWSGMVVANGLWPFVSPCTSYTDISSIHHCCIVSPFDA